MREMLRISQKADPVFAETTKELLRTTTKNLIWATGGIYLAWHFILTINWSTTWGAKIWPITLWTIATLGLALHLLPKSLFAAQLLWQGGLLLTITGALALFQRPEISFSYCLIPFLAVTTGGWILGALLEGGVILALLLLFFFKPGPLSTTYILAIISGSAATGIIGWTSSYTLTTVTHWLSFSFTQARENMEEARERRAQLAKVVKDLDQAYHRLERVNAALVAAWRAAEEAERFKAEFVAYVSHELRTPLNLIIGFSEMMITSPESYGGLEIPGPYRTDLNAIYHNAQHLLALVDDVLDLTRIEAGKISLVREETEIAGLITEAINMVHDYITAKGLELHVHIEPDLPKVWIDTLRIRQVLLNLLTNAIRFTEKGEITVKASLQGEEIRIAVSDTGQGIPPEDLPKVFEEFHSTKTLATTWHSSTGLGLPISKKFVELHGGQMGVKSTFTQGSTFWFTLPLHSQNQDSREGHLIRYQPNISPKQDKSVVLLSEDPRTALLLQRHLEGYRFIHTSSPKECISLVRELQVPLILANHQEISPLPNGIVIRCPLPSARDEAKRLGAEELLEKPVSREELTTALARLNKPIKRILIADDDPDIVRLFRRMLQTCVQPPCSFWEAHNGEEALHLIQEQHPDLVILDLIMPQMDGISVLERMAQDPTLKSIPVILISAKAQTYAYSSLSGPITIDKTNGFSLKETLQFLKAILDASTQE